MKNNDTIFAAITSTIGSAVAVLRLSGDKALPVILLMSDRKDFAKKPRTALLTKIFYGKNRTLLDQALVTFFPAPHSYSGEDVIEVALHNSPFIIKSFTNSLLAAGLRIAEAGEFSKRAFFAGKMDLLQLEAVSDLIASETEAQHSQAKNMMSGEYSDIYNKLRSQALRALALIETYIDFPDEEIDLDILNNVESIVAEIKRQLVSFLDDGLAGEILRNGIKVAIVGPPNSGKSTMLNLLAKSEVAIVSPVAGTTRDIVEVRLSLGGMPFIISDTAGIRSEIDCEIEQEGIKRAILKARSSDLLIVMVSADQELELLEEEIYNLINLTKNILIVINKSDLNMMNAQRISQYFNLKDHLIISLKNPEKIEYIANKLQAICKDRFLQVPSVITRSRHRELLQSALTLLEETTIDQQVELLAENLRCIARLIGEVTGIINVDNLLDVIFREFCIGK